MPNGSSDNITFANRAALLAARPYKISGPVGQELVFRYVNNCSNQFYVTDDTDLLAKAKFIENWRGDKNLPNT